MKRLQLIQELFKLTAFDTYLEIGCYRGRTFFPVDAKRKIAVDPFFHLLFKKDAVIWVFKSFKNIRNRYFELESDCFFKEKQSFLNSISPIDVALIDGLHTFETSLNDVINTLNYLNRKGVIIMHDCYPPNKAAALATKHFPTKAEQEAVGGWTGAWCGDVWKTIVYLRRAHSDLLSACVIDTDNGLGIVRFKANVIGNTLLLNTDLYAEIDSMTYDDLMLDLKGLLDLQPKSYAFDLIKEVVNEVNGEA